MSRGDKRDRDRAKNQAKQEAKAALLLQAQREEEECLAKQDDLRKQSEADFKKRALHEQAMINHLTQDVLGVSHFPNDQDDPFVKFLLKEHVKDLVLVGPWRSNLAS